MDVNEFRNVLGVLLQNSQVHTQYYSAGFRCFLSVHHIKQTGVSHGPNGSGGLSIDLVESCGL